MLNQLASVQKPSTLEFRRVKPRDAAEYSPMLVSLYDDVYRGTYPFEEMKDVSKVRVMLEDPRQVWWVAVDGLRIASASFGQPNPWNNAYESCRIATHQEYRGRRLAEHLYEKCLRDTLGQRPRITFAYLRTGGMVEMFTNAEFPATLVGSDMGKQIVMGNREVHPITMLVNPLMRGTTRIEPGRRFDRYDFAESEILNGTMPPEFSGTIDGNYPQQVLAGPATKEVFDSRHASLGYDYVRPSRAAEIRGATPNDGSLTPSGLAGAVDELMTERDDVDYASLYVFADKTDHIRALRDVGFSVAAYLPGWAASRNLRFDCVKMARVMDGELTYIGTKPYADRFAAGLNGR